MLGLLCLRARLLVRIVFFAHFEREAGVKEIEVATDEPLTVNELLAEVAAALPTLEEGLGHPLSGTQLRQRFIVFSAGNILSGGTEVEPEDEIWLLPPISGG